MRTKTVYIIENEDVEILRKANELMRVVYEQETEYECSEVDVDGAIYDIADFCYEQIELDDLDEDYFDDFDDDEEIEEDEEDVELTEEED